MKLILMTLLLSSSYSFASLDMKPGLWSMAMVIKSDGKEINPTEQMQKAMANMPEEQKKKMTEMMARMNTGIGKNGETQVCYSKKMIENPELLGKNTDQKCDTKLLTNNSKTVKSSFKCNDGTSGDATWDIKTSETLTGLVNVKDPKGKKSQINYNGKFLKADCGSVKPVI